MKTLAILLAAAAALSTGSVATAAERATDAQYLQAARCQGLARASATDSSGVDAFLKAQKQGRSDYVKDTASTRRHEAERELRGASGADLQRLTAEREACARFGSTKIAASTQTASR